MLGLGRREFFATPRAERDANRRAAPVVNDEAVLESGWIEVKQAIGALEAIRMLCAGTIDLVLHHFTAMDRHEVTLRFGSLELRRSRGLVSWSTGRRRRVVRRKAYQCHPPSLHRLDNA